MTLTVGILSALAALLGIVREVLRRRNAPHATLTPKQAAEIEAHKARQASAQGDARDINARMERHRMRKGLALAALAGALASGCCYRLPQTYHTEVVPCPYGCSSEIPHIIYVKGGE